MNVDIIVEISRFWMPAAQMGFNATVLTRESDTPVRKYLQGEYSQADDSDVEHTINRLQPFDDREWNFLIHVDDGERTLAGLIPS